MKKIIIAGIIASVIGLMAPRITPAQGTITYLSGLGQPSTGSVAVGSDSWLAVGFGTGNNAGGYVLNSVQLGMADASGSPSGFTVMLYTAVGLAGLSPGSSLGTLSGSLNPVTSGIYTYTPASSLTLSTGTDYFIVLTAATAIANGAYWLSECAFPPSSSGNWGADNAVIQSSDGISGWLPTPYLGIAQFAITATPVPEPGTFCLFGLGGLGFLWHRRRL